MSQTSCINHPSGSRFVVIYDWQVELCEGNTTTAALLSFFERWHNLKLAMRPKNIHSNNIASAHGDERSQDESTLQFHSEQELIDGIQSIGKRDSVRKSINWLESRGFISIHSNPNKRYAFDKTRYFQFYPDVVNEWLKTGMSINRPPMSEKQSRSSEKQSRSSEKQQPSSEITSAITDHASKETSDHTSNEEDSPSPHAIAVVIESVLEQNPVAPDSTPIITQDLSTVIVESVLDQNVPANENNNQNYPLSEQEREALKQAQIYAFNPAIAPWRDAATIVNAKVQKAIFDANPKWYSTGSGSVNVKKINDRIKSLERQMRGIGVEAIEAYSELMNYVTMAQIPNSAEIVKKADEGIKRVSVINNLRSHLEQSKGKEWWQG
jgi:hypothetical protein